MLADHVYCGDCGKEMHTNVGAEVCPFCGKYGALQYIDPNEPEIELNYELKNVKYVWDFDSKSIHGNGVEELYYEEV